MNYSGDFCLEKIVDINRLPYSLGKHLGQLPDQEFGVLYVQLVCRQNDVSNWIEYYAICNDE